MVFGSLILVVSAPLWPLIALAIKAETPGPVLFRQRRRGRYQTTIEILKFRTMRVMEDGSDVRQAVPGDVRVTVRVSWSNLIPACDMTISIIGMSRSACPVAIGSNAKAIDGVSVRRPRPAAAEQASKHVSSARMFIPELALDDPRHFVEGKSW